MKTFFKILGVLVLFGIFTALAGVIWVAHDIGKPGAFDEARPVLIAPGTSGYAIAQQLRDEDIISNSKVFYALLRYHHASVKAGEYEIPAHASMNEVLALLESGKVIQRQFTLAEGLTVKQALILLDQNKYLTGDVETPPKEGSLLPETYIFTRGDTRQSIIDQMQKAHAKILGDLWEKRDKTLPLKSKKEAVILASIVERETGKANERARIAGLFYNRLKIGMPLQSDPTVVYVITDRLGHMQGKPLLATDLQVDSPYNTYQHIGLPPAPIANPGLASLQAVFAPEENDYLFFVADGTGGHVFAKDLAAHQENVERWRRIKKRLNSIP